jgi:hypothetical protein
MDRSRVDVMQVTLVAHYGPKPAALSAFIARVQDCLRSSPGLALQPYDIDQVHATIVGLEGCRVQEGIRGSRSGRPMNLSGVVEFLRSKEFEPIQVRIGGFRADVRYTFRSRDLHPHLRSFSIQGDTALVIGWPVENEHSPNSLDQLRRLFQRFGTSHKWHAAAEDVDNDLFLVLGRLDRRHDIDPALVERLETSVRADLASGAASVEISRETLSFVGYVDSQLPRATSHQYSLDEPDLAVKLTELYPVCDDQRRS